MAAEGKVVMRIKRIRKISHNANVHSAGASGVSNDIGA